MVVAGFHPNDMLRAAVGLTAALGIQFALLDVVAHDTARAMIPAPRIRAVFILPPAPVNQFICCAIDVRGGGLDLAHCPMPRYPVAARRDGYEGVVSLRLHTSTNGVVTKAWIDKSSGHWILDAAVLAAFRSCQFLPTIVDGTLSETNEHISYEFAIDHSGLVDP